MDFAEAGELAVARAFVARFRVNGGAEQAGFDEAVLVEQIGEALARVEYAGGAPFRQLVRPAHGECLDAALLEVFQQIIVCHI